MSAKIVQRSSESVTIQITVPLKGHMLENEEIIQQELNRGGTLVTQEALQRFDTDGSPIQIGELRLTSKGRSPEKYQTPYGTVNVMRHTYQSSKGGKTFCPLEAAARTVLNATPRYAKMICFKYASFGANLVARDFEESHARKISRGYIKNVVDFIDTIAAAKEENWGYALPELEAEPACISLGMDGTCLLLKDGGWREAMAGTIAFYDTNGDRLHTIYIGAAPEYGKASFLERFTREIGRVKTRYPAVHYQGLADGAVDNWNFLGPHVDTQVLDFFHASEYVGEAAWAIYPFSLGEREEWLEDRLHKLKHKQGAAKRLLNEMIALHKEVKGVGRKEKLKKAITYFTNHHTKMRYAANTAKRHPIGSGVTEAACKVLVKQRLCGSGMRWKEKGASVILSIRALILTRGRWEEFWRRISRYGTGEPAKKQNIIS